MKQKFIKGTAFAVAATLLSGTIATSASAAVDEKGNIGISKESKVSDNIVVENNWNTLQQDEGTKEMIDFLNGIESDPILKAELGSKLNAPINGPVNYDFSQLNGTEQHLNPGLKLAAQKSINWLKNNYEKIPIPTWLKSKMGVAIKYMGHYLEISSTIEDWLTRSIKQVAPSGTPDWAIKAAVKAITLYLPI
ncbi:hypothetical protein [Bacillus wiedmannii]|uniref:hypothetical protein n=1 Tax=Bacillus wiedmannii TaxID=1890302 RepID=UPI000BFBB0AE|nr:hypothetical protein [Bacillus wiedmannii]PHG43884.1 hypothetical protein COI54_21935 [Bacillus wiedmannii]